ncbi:MAG: ABC transporter substrate-binding protein [Acidimicrobiales bacterium]
MRAHRGAVTGAAVVMALLGSACGSSTTAKTAAGGGVATVTVATNNTNDSLPIAVAQTEGFFAKHHLAVKSKTLSNIALVPSLLGKEYDIGFSVAPIIIRAASAGVPIVTVSGNDGDAPTTNPGVEVFVRPGTTIAQLAGKKVASPTLTGNINLATKAWLSKNGVKPTAVQFVQVATPDMVGELKAGQIDGAELIYPFITLAKQAGLVSLGDPESALSHTTLGGTYWVANTAWAKKNSTVVTEFRAALAEADQWISTNPAKAYQVAATFTGVTLSQAKLSPLGHYTTKAPVKDFKIWGKAMKKFGGFNGSVKYSSLVLAP